MGRLVADPELRQTPNGVSVITFTVAVDRNYSRDRERQTDFIDVVAWRQTAEFVSKYFSKGKMIIVEGSIQTRSYEDRNGNKRRAVEVDYYRERTSFVSVEIAGQIIGFLQSPARANTMGPSRIQ